MTCGRLEKTREEFKCLSSSSRVTLELKTKSTSCFSQCSLLTFSEEPLESEAARFLFKLHLAVCSPRPGVPETRKRLEEPCLPSCFSSSLLHMCCCPRHVSRLPNFSQLASLRCIRAFLSVQTAPWSGIGGYVCQFKAVELPKAYRVF